MRQSTGTKAKKMGRPERRSECMGRRRRKGKGAWGNYTITAKKKKKCGGKRKGNEKSFS